MQLAKDIYRASEAGIVNGYTDGNFGMNDLLLVNKWQQIIDNALEDYLKLERNEATLNFSDRMQSM